MLGGDLGDSYSKHSWSRLVETLRTINTADIRSRPSCFIVLDW